MRTFVKIKKKLNNDLPTFSSLFFNNLVTKLFIVGNKQKKVEIKTK